MPLQQEIRFCVTADGVRLALASTGSGPALVRAGTWLGHLECDAREEDAQAHINEFSRHHTFIRYDSRGCGLSDRRVPSLAFDDLVTDLEAVVAARGLERFALLGVSMGAAISVAYAARHPDKVSHLVLLNGFASSYFSARELSPQMREEAELLLKNAQVGWGNSKSIFRHVFMAQMLGTSSPQMQRMLEERMQLSMTPEMAVAYLRNNYAINVREQCAQIKCPTLVMHSRGDEMISFEQGRRLAALIPGSRFVPLECAGHHVLASEPASQVMHEEVAAFLGFDAKRASGRAGLTPRQLESLQAVASGLTDKEIARQLGLSPRTVEMHVGAALKALGCTTRAEAVHTAMRQGLLQA